MNLPIDIFRRLGFAITVSVSSATNSFSIGFDLTFATGGKFTTSFGSSGQFGIDFEDK